MYSTLSLAYSYNVGDILLVIVQKLPITKDLDDLIQRVGRCIRKGGLTKYGVFIQFFLYQLNDINRRLLEGIDISIYTSIVLRDEGEAITLYQVELVSAYRYALTRLSGLRNTTILGKDLGGNLDQDGDTEYIGDRTNRRNIATVSNKKDQTKQELDQRTNILKILRSVVNSKYLPTLRYFRIVSNEYYNEDLKIYNSDPIRKDQYYDFYNLELRRLAEQEKTLLLVPKAKTIPKSRTK